MKSYTIYTGSDFGMLKCAAYDGENVVLRTVMANETSAPVEIETANICLKSEYDAEQTLIPGVTKRTVYYKGLDLEFAIIRWNRDETYTIDFKDELIIAAHSDPRSYTFTIDGVQVASISRPADKTPLREGGVSYDPAYKVEYEEGLSQQALIMILVFPVLYFGF